MREDSTKGRSGMTTTNRTKRLAAAVLASSVMLTLAAGFAPVQEAAGAAELTGTFSSKIQASTRTATVLTTAAAPLGNAVTPATRTVTTITRSTSSTTSTRRTRAAAPAGTTATAPASDELAQARSILAGYIARYPILAGTTVSFGDARGYQAISYYKSGRIVISSSHTASLERIIGHEIWHVIDWRDNGVIDWGENVPPR